MNKLGAPQIVYTHQLQAGGPGSPMRARSLSKAVAVIGKAGLYSSATHVKSVAELDRIPSAAEVMRNAFGEARTIADSGNRAVRNRETWPLLSSGTESSHKVGDDGLKFTAGEAPASPAFSPRFHGER